jgi:hypothetical protein
MNKIYRMFGIYFVHFVNSVQPQLLSVSSGLDIGVHRLLMRAALWDFSPPLTRPQVSIRFWEQRERERD